MFSFHSTLEVAGPFCFPSFTGVRVQLMPVDLSDPERVPDYMDEWKPALATLFNVVALAGIKGIGYLTIDEKFVLAGETHRRPGLHVDGYGSDVIVGGNESATHTASPISYPPPKPKPLKPKPDPLEQLADIPLNPRGMLQASTHVGCQAWVQKFTKEPKPDGVCKHLRRQCRPSACVVLHPNVLYWMDGLTVHESLIHPVPVQRQFLRLSMPSDAPWYSEYTENPLGVKPTGPILKGRPKAFMQGKEK